ncbi:PAS domain S-box protein, partial [Chloroflexota bacterium]
IGKSFEEYLTPDDRQLATDQHERVMRGEAAPAEWYEATAIKKDGTEVICEANVKPIEYEGEPAFSVIIRDITEHRQVEEAVRQSEEKYRAIFENATDAILIADVESGSIIYSNPSASEMFGYSNEEIQALDKWALHPRDSQELVRAAFLDILSSRVSSRLEIPCLRKDGSILYTDLNAAQINLGGRSYVAGFLTDITERKQAEEKYRQLLEDMSDGYAVIQGGEYVFVNRRFGEILGYEPKQIMGRSVTEFIMTKDRQKEIETYERVVGGEEDPYTYYEAQATRGDGVEIICEISSRHIEYEGKPAIGVITRDVTERKQAEEKYRQLLEDMNDGYIVVQEGKIVYANGEFGRITGYKPEEVVGRPVGEITWPESRQAVKGMHERYMQGGEVVVEHYDGAIARKDGTKITVETSIRAIEYEGKPAVCAIVRDVTQRKLVEQELRESEERFLTAFNQNPNAMAIMELPGGAFCRCKRQLLTDG